MKALTLLTALLACAPALAQPSRENLLLGGIGVGAVRSPYRGMDAKTRVLPMVVYENAWVSVALPSVDIKLGQAGPVSFRLRTRYGFDGYKPKDSDYFSGMERRKDSLWLGPVAAWNTGVGTVSFQLLGDTLGHSKATQWELQYDRRIDFGPLAVTPRVAIHGLDRNYVDYYYGVRASEATSARPAFNGDSAYETEVGVRLTYRLDDRQTLMADLGGTRLGQEIRRSPLLARGYRASMFTGYVYRF